MSTPRILRLVVVTSATLLGAACSAGGSAERCRRDVFGGTCRQSDYRRRVAKPGAERPPQLGPAARRLEVGHNRRHRHRSDRRQRLGLRALRRPAAGGAGGGAVDCEINPVDPIFKFDRNTGAVLANFGKGVMVTPHGISVDKDGNV